MENIVINTLVNRANVSIIRMKSIIFPSGRIFVLIGFITLLFCLFLFGSFYIVYGQENSNDWEEPLIISNTVTHASHFPSLAVDIAGGVHVVWQEDLGMNQSLVYYSYFDGNSWSTPVDIFIDSDTSVPSIATDSNGYLHIVWSGNPALSYSKVSISMARSVDEWLSPRPILVDQSGGNFPDLVIDKHDTLHLVYSKPTGLESGIYYTFSSDQGVNWQGPYQIHTNILSNYMVDEPRLAVDLNGKIHVVWVESNFPNTFPPLGIHYANSIDGGLSWSVSENIADGPYDQPGITIRSDNEVHVVWSGTNPDRFKFHRWSSNGGENWSGIQRIEELGGYQGWPTLVVDSDQNLYWNQVGSIFSNQYGGSRPDSLVIQEWQGQSWTPAEILLTSSVIEHNIRNVSAAIALGNVMHLALEVPLKTPSGELHWEIYYLTKELDATSWKPEQILLPSEEIDFNSFSNTLSTPESISHNITPNSNLTMENPFPNENLWSPILVGIFPIILILILIIIRRRKYQGY